MTTLYVDKYRGFSDTLIPIEDVTFLVGENSTGKSSILALINLMCSPDFWFSQNFNLSEHEFGGFRDILSANAGKNDEFTFGVASRLHRPNNQHEIDSAYLVSYKESNALPSISFYARLYNRHILSFRNIDGKFRYRTKELNAEDIPSDAKSIFNLLKQERHVDQAALSDTPKDMPSRAGFFSIIAMLEAVSQNNSRAFDEMSFPVHMFAHNIAWLAPIRTRPKRTYDGYGHQYSPEGEHTPYVLRTKLTSTDEKNNFKDALVSFGKDSGLFSDLIVHELGRDASAPFELLIKLKNRRALHLNSVGYGVSQALPLVVEMLARDKKTWFAIQQPEVHLHPKAQAALGDLIFQTAKTRQQKFLIETHSDYTVDRFRMQFRNNPDHKIKAQVLFFNRKACGNVVTPIPILFNGDFSSEQPKEFREFFLKEQLDLLQL